MKLTTLHCLSDHPTGRLDADLARRFGKADAHGAKLGAVSWSMEWTGRTLRRFEDTRPECIAVYCGQCRRWTEYAMAAEMREAA